MVGISANRSVYFCDSADEAGAAWIDSLVGAVRYVSGGSVSCFGYHGCFSDTDRLAVFIFERPYVANCSFWNSADSFSAAMAVSAVPFAAVFSPNSNSP